MHGIAKTLFIETHQRSPWKQHQEARQTPAWPFLEYFLSIQALSHIDFAFVKMLWHEDSQLTEEAAAFICHLTMAARQGHLCVRVVNENMIPDCLEIWGQEALPLPSQQDFQKITQMVVNGVKDISPAFITDVAKWVSDDKPLTPICRLNDLIYLQKHWVYETRLLHHLQRIVKSKPSIDIDRQAIKASVENLVCQGALLPEQAQAIHSISDNGLSIIVGGPGTGKTYTAGQLIKVYWEALSHDQRKHYEIALAAPTGKAAANLQKSLNAAATALIDFKPLNAKTIHALLGIGKNRGSSDHDYKMLSADLIIVDESSMIDVQLMADLFRAVKEGARVVLLGDQHQLPSVEAGGILSDLIEYQNENKPSGFACTALKTCLRTDLKEIVEFAEAINEGHAEKVLSMLDKVEKNQAVGRLHFSCEKSKQSLIKHLGNAFLGGLDDGEDFKKLMTAFNRIRILSPMHKGAYGVEECNAALLRHYRKQAQGKAWFAAPIIVISNDYRQDLYNGETGLLVRRQGLNGPDGISEGDYAVFPSRTGGEDRRIPAILLPKYEYAYCLSIHKSQGSEFDEVILLMPEGSERFGREIFYTAVTRAKKQLHVFGEDDVFRKVVERRSRRLSGLPSRLAQRQ